MIFTLNRKRNQVCISGNLFFHFCQIIAKTISIASGGAGTLEHFYDALTEGGADAALAASLFHYKELEISQVKDYLSDRGISVRR